MADMEPVQILSTPPFSSNDPRTDGLRMLPVDDNPEYGDFEAEEISDEEKAVAEIQPPRYVPIEDTSGVGEDTTENDSQMKASEWVDEIDAATTQEELDSILSRFEATGKEYSTVTAAAEAKQAEIDAQNA